MAQRNQVHSPSFSGNFFRVPDLNAITPDTSPASTLSKEHPTGIDYVEYLENIARFHDLPVEVAVDVQNVKKEGNSFTLSTIHRTYISRYLLWAAGEYQYPRTQIFPVSDLCQHYSEVNSFSGLAGDEFIVIGGFESGFDATINLVNVGKKVTMIDESNYIELVKSDSS